MIETGSSKTLDLQVIDRLIMFYERKQKVRDTSLSSGTRHENIHVNNAIE